MQTFREFLEGQELQIRVEEAKKKEKIDLWTRSVAELADQVTSWLEEDDSKKLLKIEKRLVEVSEESVGNYQVISLTIWLGGRAVKFIPISCMVRGPVRRPKSPNWLGRVDLIGAMTYNLYYGWDLIEPSWVAVHDTTYAVTPFSREFFENAMVELFS